MVGTARPRNSVSLWPPSHAHSEIHKRPLSRFAAVSYQTARRIFCRSVRNATYLLSPNAPQFHFGALRRCVFP